MRSLYVLSFTWSRGVGNREINFGGVNQAESDILTAGDRDLRYGECQMRRPCRRLRGLGHDLRQGNRIMRESR